jgi:hypothetical protein
MSYILVSREYILQDRISHFFWWLCFIWLSKTIIEAINFLRANCKDFDNTKLLNCIFFGWNASVKKTFAFKMNLLPMLLYNTAERSWHGYQCTRATYSVIDLLIVHFQGIYLYIVYTLFSFFLYTVISLFTIVSNSPYILYGCIITFQMVKYR